MQDRCGAASKPKSRSRAIVSGVYDKVEPPAPKVTDTYSGFIARNLGMALSSVAFCSSVLGGKNSNEIGIFTCGDIPACGFSFGFSCADRFHESFELARIERARRAQSRAKVQSE